MRRRPSLAVGDPPTSRRRSTLLVLVLASLSVLLLDATGGGVVEGLRDGAVDALAPVRSGAGAVLGPVGDLADGLGGGDDDLDEENERLRRRVDELEGERAAVAAGERSLRHALALLEIGWLGDVPAVGARVVGAPVSNFEETVELDKGSGDGVAEGMPVVAARGLVGRVVEVSSQRARVRLLTDPVSAVAVRLVRSGDTSSAEGAGSDEALSALFVETTTRLRPEDLAVTSGLEGGAFPADIPVGRVEEAAPEPGQLSQDVRLRPTVDLDRLDLVRVLRWVPA